ncbi:MAG: CPBP family intramembrane metalloprotease [Candidatus Riflebacteria bacterium]|nr:CPBP family intramembrane metalloprotease [Candidatus Riflebacteria bacterium]
MSTFLKLLVLKSKLLVRHFARKGKAASALFFLLYYPLFALGAFVFVRDQIHLIRSELLGWILPGLATLLYGAWLAMMVLTELQFSFVLNLAQRSSDNEFLATLPLPLGTVVLVKSVERMLSDFTIPPALGAALGFAWAAGGSPAQVGLSTLAVLGTSFAAGMAFFLAHLALARRWSLHQIRQICFLLQPIGLLPLLLIPAFTEGYIQPAEVLNTLRAAEPYLSWTPPHGFARGLLGWADGQRHLCLVPLSLLAGAAVCMWFVAGRMQRTGWGFLPEKGQLSSDRSRDPGRTIRWPSFRLLGALHWKDSRLLLRDKNLLGNALLVPLILVVYWLLAFGEIVRAHPTALVVTFLFFAFYFNGFGAMNAAGMEGRGIALVRSLPMSALGFLGRKAVFWSVLTAGIYIPLFVLFACRIDLPADRLASGAAWLALGCPTLATLGVGLSAVFANYEAQVLQQGSTLGGKGIFFVLSALFLFCPTVEPPWLAVRSVLLFEGLVIAVFLVGARAIESHEDPDAHPPGRLFVTDGIALALGMVMAQSPLIQLLSALLSPIQPGLLLALVSLIVGPIVCKLSFRYLTARCGSPWTALGLAGGGRRWAPLAALLIAPLHGLWIEAFYRFLQARQGFDRESIVQSGRLWAEPIATHGAAALVVVLALVVVAPIVEETLFRGVLFTALRHARFSRWGAIVASALLFSLIHPPLDAVAVIPLGMALAWVYERTGSLAAPVLLHGLANAAVLVRAYLYL